MSTTALLPVPLALEQNISFVFLGSRDYRVACSHEFFGFHYTPIIPTSVLLCTDDAVSDSL